MGKNIVELKGISKVYWKDSTKIEPINGVSMEIEVGEFIAIMGPSGSGKTTLLNLIGGIDTPTNGEIIVDGVNISQMPSYKLARWRTNAVSYIYQYYNLIPVLTAFENVELPLLLFNMSQEERKRHATVALKAVALEDRMGYYPYQLSGGQEQRVAIARAIVTDPKIILADEPTGNLDENTAKEIMILTAELNKRFQKTFIIVTHNPEISKWADKVFDMHTGKIIVRKASRDKEVLYTR